ncbi:transient receptor potential cation channel subfamily V member 5-like [Lytechinus variegatus]|uniref:transient receptor potential cation channel subfamily V member 5-like n=1 Tax=Lytechinus variegatus TaxID=7654 RepID=UPI001BB28D9F|nr:transient receptor potential cation channel subfamily V member 5-like [Lytechinus variegatus]XP_041460455.1 transient receptor potential cation channel subfamily V member 5-like [Lytechinus variegatus]
MLRRMKNAVVSRFQGTRVDPDAEWRKQNAAADENEMYQLMYFNERGKLVEEYRHVLAGHKTLEDFRCYIRENVGKMLYNEGKGKTITQLEYARYKLIMFDGKKPETPDNELMSIFEDGQVLAINKFKEHEACFDLNKRGAIGETILHMCFLNDTRMHREIASHLLSVYPKLALDVYEGSDFFGESALHMAIVNKDFRSVQLLVGRYKARLDQRATGRFFRPDDLKERKYVSHKKSFYEGTAYLGEYPLAFCASTGAMEMYDYFIDQSLRRKPGEGRCHPNAQDSFGNTVVHMAIIHNQTLLFYHAIHHNKMPASYTIPNEAGLTALQLSFQLGRNELFSALLELSSETQWTYGKIAYVAYPLSILDSIDEKGNLNSSAALSVIVQYDTINHLRMLEGQVIDELLKVKWNMYVKHQFAFKLFWALIHLTWLFIAVQLRPAEGLLEGRDSVSKFRYVSEVCVIVGCVAKTATELTEIRARGSVTEYLKSLADFPTKALFMIAVVLLFICIPLRFMGLEWYENILIMFIVPLSWSYLLFFFRGHPSLGPMVVVFFKMLKGDLLRFSLIYFILLIVFAQAFFFLFRDSGAMTSSFKTISETFISTFIMTNGEFNWRELYECRMPWLAIIMFVVFMWFISVLMLNMVIAMMARTFDIIKERSRMEWKRQWAMIVLNVERSVLRPKLAKVRKAYSFPLKIKHRVGIMDSAEPETSDNHSRPSLQRKSTIQDVKVKKFKRGTRLVHMNSVAQSVIMKEVDAFTITKVLPHSKAERRRKAKKRWKNLIRNVIVQQRFGVHGSPGRAFMPTRINHKNPEVPTISRGIKLPPIGEHVPSQLL